MKFEQVDILMSIHRKTDSAILASDDGDRDNAVWLPLSQIEMVSKGQWVEVTMPEWLAKDKGLI
jgi:hypothetical protein